MPKPQVTEPSVFVSYSRQDEAWKDRLVKHLRVSLDPEVIRVWDDTRIPAGSAWAEELQSAMRGAKLALLLISADYLASSYVREVEMPALLERSRKGELPVLPVLVRPCAWKTVDWIADRPILPAGDRALSGGTEASIDADLAEIAETVHQQLNRAA